MANALLFSLSLVFILFFSNLSLGEVSTDWYYVHGANEETLFSFFIPNFSNAEKLDLPYRLNLPNSVFWYYKKIKTKSNLSYKGRDETKEVFINLQF